MGTKVMDLSPTACEMDGKGGIVLEAVKEKDGTRKHRDEGTGRQFC